MSTTPPIDPTDRPTPADDQPTEAYPPAAPADHQPTEAYPPAPPAPQAPAQAPYGQAPYGQAPYGQAQGYAPAPAGPDTRSKGIAWTALSLAIVGIVLSLIGLIPVAWVGLIAVIIGGLVLLAAFVFAIVGLAGKRNGGKPLSITALVLSVIGGTIGAFALIWAIVVTGLAASGTSLDSESTGVEPAPAPTAEISGGAEDGAADDGAATVDEAAFIAEVRPKVNDIMAQIDPTATPDVVAQALPDETLVMIGQALLVSGEAGIDQIVDQTFTGSGASDEDIEKLRSLYQEILASAQAHLQ
ncbi:hypothetical protein [Microbacterium sp.]|uniref:hypothetical protein n=1 Tax=Microbacterium sp. TaxID=51671 RepID=UPI00289E7106|nr:hypothetical protein [Microbacterium sp.]